MRVLIAEEFANSREALAEFFRSQATEVAVAKDGQQAIAHLQVNVFDAVIVHLNLPRGGASEVAQQAWARNSSTVIVVVTAFGDGFRTVFRSPHSNLFLVQKPFRAGELLKLIQEARSNKSLKEFAPSEKIDRSRPLVHYGAHRTDNEKV